MYFHLSVFNLFSGDHVYCKESETLYDHAVTTFANMAVDSDIKRALQAIPDDLADYAKERLAGRTEMTMGFAIRSAKARTKFEPHVRQYLIGKFEQGRISGKKFDARDISREMRSAKKAGTEQPMFTPKEFLTWQQIASFWSTYARTNNKREGAVIDSPNDSVAEIDNDVYMSDPNLEVHDAQLDEVTEKALASVTVEPETS